MVLSDHILKTLVSIIILKLLLFVADIAGDFDPVYEYYEYDPISDDSKTITIPFYAPNDGISLEYDDIAELIFAPIQPELVNYARLNGVFILTRCTVYIVDNDSE